MMGRYSKGEHVKFEVVSTQSGESEWMWLLVDRSDDENGLVFGRLDSEPVGTIEWEGLHASYCSPVAFSGGDILVAAAVDHFAAQGAIYRRPIEKHGVLVPVGDGLPRWIDGIADTGCIATNASAIVVADRAGNLYLSADSGRTWSCSVSGLPTPSSVLIC